MTLDDTLSQIAREAVLDIGPDLVRAFSGPIDIEFKADFHDPVTIHDRRAEARIRSLLFEALPDSIMLGEEEGNFIDSQGKRVPYDPDRVLWLVDPIDGTSNFAGGLERWCISIGAAVEDRMAAGVIFQPLTDRLYHTDSHGAYVNGTKMTVSRAQIAASIIPSDFPSAQAAQRQGAWETYHRVVTSAKSMRRHGSTALDLAGVAHGVFGGTFGVAHPWDVAAGIALVEKAGGTYVGIDETGALRTARQWEAPAYAVSGNPDTLLFLQEAMAHVEIAGLITNYFN